MRPGGTLKRLSLTRQRIKDAIYGDLGRLHGGKMEPEVERRVVDLMERVLYLEDQDGHGGLTRFVNHLPEPLATDLVEILQRLLDVEQK